VGLKSKLGSGFSVHGSLFRDGAWEQRAPSPQETEQVVRIPRKRYSSPLSSEYMGTSLIRNIHPPRTTIGP